LKNIYLSFTVLKVGVDNSNNKNLYHKTVVLCVIIFHVTPSVNFVLIYLYPVYSTSKKVVFLEGRIWSSQSEQFKKLPKSFDW